MRVLVACEESQVVTAAFRTKGHVAFSCDIVPTSGSRPDWHIQADVLTILNQSWDLVIAHPPCTHLSSSGARHWKEKQADGRQQTAIDFFMGFTCLSRVCIENPVGIMSTLYRKPDQIIQPWQFGHGETKSTCLWLKGLPPLTPTTVVAGREPKCHLMPPSKDRARLRSKTYQGIADAMASQWG